MTKQFNSNIEKFDKHQDVEIVEKSPLYQGFIKLARFTLRHKLFSGGWSSVIHRELVERRGVAAALLYDPNLDKVVMIRQFRIGALQGIDPWLLEVVAGVSEDHDDNMQGLIIREIKEESGLETLALHQIYEYWMSPGGSDEYVTLFCAKVDASQAGGIHGLAHESEDILVQVLTCEEAFSLLAKGEIRNSITLIALQWLQLNKDYLRSLWLV